MLAFGWELAIVSNVNDRTFHYFSDSWTSGTPFGTDDLTDTKNALYPSYTTTYVESIKIWMDGSLSGTCTTCTYEFVLPDEYKGKYTLQELVTLDGGVSASTKHHCPNFSSLDV